MVKILYIFILYIAVIKTAAGTYFRQSCNMIISIRYKKKLSNVFQKEKTFPWASQIFEVCKRKVWLEKGWRFKTFVQKFNCYKEDFTKLMVWWSPSKIDCEQRISYLWTKNVLFSYIESLRVKTLKEPMCKYWLGNHVHLISRNIHQRCSVKKVFLEICLPQLLLRELPPEAAIGLAL